MPRATITPWRSRTDLLTVRAALYDASSAVRHHAVRRVMAWKLRGNLPHAIESTALLVDAVLHHSNASSQVSLFSMRAVYAAAFTRFVTGFCDIGRNRERTLEPSSMLAIAKHIGMPVHFVAMRHEATHAELPSVGRLVKVCGEALDWLWEVYWNRLEGMPPNDEEIPLSAVRANAKQGLKAFRGERLEALRRKKREEQSAGVVKAVKACGELMERDEEKMRAVTDVLVEDRFLCPSKRTLGSSIEGAFLIWDELLRGLISEHRQGASILLGSLLRAIDTPATAIQQEDVEKEALSLWTLHIVTDHLWASEIGESSRQSLQKEVIQWCSMHPSFWAMYIGTRILEVADDDFRDDWQNIFEESRLRNQSAHVAVAGGAEALAAEMSRQALLERFAEDDTLGGGPESPSWRKGPTLHSTPFGVVVR